MVKGGGLEKRRSSTRLGKLQENIKHVAVSNVVRMPILPQLYGGRKIEAQLL
jgi:hypothetical protein